MKKNILLLFLFFTINLFAQSFTFNHLMHYVCKTNDKSADIIIYVNTDNPQYYLSVYNTYPIKKARLYDLVKSKAYNFEVIESKVNNQIDFRFKYQNFDYIKIPKQNNLHLKFEEQEEGVQRMYLYKKAKKVDGYFGTIKAQASEKDLFSAFRFFAMHPFEHNLSLKSIAPIKVTNAKIVNQKKSVNYELLLDKPITLEIKIPKL